MHYLLYTTVHTKSPDLECMEFNDSDFETKFQENGPQIGRVQNRKQPPRCRDDR